MSWVSLDSSEPGLTQVVEQEVRRYAVVPLYEVRLSESGKAQSPSHGLYCRWGSGKNISCCLVSQIIEPENSMS